MSARETDVRLTPPWLLDQIRRMGPIALDPCSTRGNPTEARQWWYGEDFDGLVEPWAGMGFAYVNPPYSRGQLDQWAAKATLEAISGCEILMLTPADVSTGWFGWLRRHADSVCLLSRRVGFVLPDGSPMPGAKFGSALWYWGRRRALFRSLYDGELGWVVDLPGAMEVGNAAE